MRPNLLLLDEATNDLDLSTIEVLDQIDPMTALSVRAVAWKQWEGNDRWKYSIRDTMPYLYYTSNISLP
jgi:hypothetical protein